MAGEASYHEEFQEEVEKIQFLPHFVEQLEADTQQREKFVQLLTHGRDYFTESNLAELIKWDIRILQEAGTIVQWLRRANELMSFVSPMHKIAKHSSWSAKKGEDLSIYTINGFEGELDKIHRHFDNQLKHDRNTLEYLKNESFDKANENHIKGFWHGQEFIGINEGVLSVLNALERRYRRHEIMVYKLKIITNERVKRFNKLFENADSQHKMFTRAYKV